MKKIISKSIFLYLILFSVFSILSYSDEKTLSNFNLKKFQVTKGTVSVIKKGNVKIHSYKSGADGGIVTTQIIETKNKLIVVDTQFVKVYAEEVSKYIKSLKKPVERVIISHEHPDHWFGSEYFKEYKIYANKFILDKLSDTAQSTVDTRKKQMGDTITSEAVIPKYVLNDGEEIIDGVKFVFETFKDVEAPYLTVVKLPESKVLIAQDLIYSNAHLVLINNQFEGWINSLEKLKLEGYETILPGHGNIADNSVFDENIEYLKLSKKLYDEGDKEKFISTLKEKYKEYEATNFVDFSASVLFKNKVTSDIPKELNLNGEFYPESIAFGLNKLFVSSYSTGEIQMYDFSKKDFNPITFIENRNEDPKSAWGLLVDEDNGLLYVAYNNKMFSSINVQSKIIAYDINTKTIKKEIIMPLGVKPNSIVKDLNGNLYISDVGENPKILKIDVDNKITVFKIDKRWKSSNGFGLGGLALDDSKGILYGAGGGNRIWKVRIDSNGMAGELVFLDTVDENENKLDSVFFDGYIYVGNDTLYGCMNDTGIPGSKGALQKIIINDNNAKVITIKDKLKEPSGVAYGQINGNKYIFVSESQFDNLFITNNTNKLDMPFKIKVIKE